MEWGIRKDVIIDLELTLDELQAIVEACDGQLSILPAPQPALSELTNQLRSVRHEAGA
jgi:hypothetical protein